MNATQISQNAAISLIQQFIITEKQVMNNVALHGSNFCVVSETKRNNKRNSEL